MQVVMNMIKIEIIVIIKIVIKKEGLLTIGIIGHQKEKIRLVLGLSVSILVMAIGLSIQVPIMPCASGSGQ